CRFRDAFSIAFPNRFPTLAGYCLLAPLEHREGVVSDFSEDDYLRLQRVVHRLGRAISAVVPTERLYVLSLGSRQGNSHGALAPRAAATRRLLPRATVP